MTENQNERPRPSTAGSADLRAEINSIRAGYDRIGTALTRIEATLTELEQREQQRRAQEQEERRARHLRLARTSQNRSRGLSRHR